MGFNRVIIIIIDACGVGALPDAADYGDTGAATIPNLSRSVGGLRMPTCQSLGLGNIVPIQAVPPSAKPIGCFGRMAEKSAGKDSTVGHWEIAGLIQEKPLPLFPEGFPAEIINRIESSAGIKTIGNEAASGTEIIERLGKEHLETGHLILYTSADSVLQLAAHEDICTLEHLYEICRAAREQLSGKYGVGRVIARPFTGLPGSFTRTDGRRDFSLPPPADTVLDQLKANGRRVLSVGKIHDLFADRGISNCIDTVNNSEVMDIVRQAVRHSHEHDLIFANCVDFDMLWGHRNDEISFARGLAEFDERLADILPLLRPDDLLIITADHGCDPTIKTSTDHTREYVPLIAYGPNANHGIDLGTRATFADVAATVAQIFGIKNNFQAKSFLPELTPDWVEPFN